MPAFNPFEIDGILSSHAEYFIVELKKNSSAYRQVPLWSIAVLITGRLYEPFCLYLS